MMPSISIQKVHPHPVNEKSSEGRHVLVHREENEPEWRFLITLLDVHLYLKWPVLLTDVRRSKVPFESCLSCSPWKEHLFMSLELCTTQNSCGRLSMSDQNLSGKINTPNRHCLRPMGVGCASRDPFLTNVVWSNETQPQQKIGRGLPLIIWKLFLNSIIPMYL